MPVEAEVRHNCKLIEQFFMFKTSKKGGLSHLSVFLLPALCSISHKREDINYAMDAESNALQQKSVEMFTYY